MNKRLTYNYWLLIASWSLFLSDYFVLGSLLVLMGCAVLAKENYWEMNYWRLMAVGTTSSLIFLIILSTTNISLFFQNIRSFLIMISVNLAFTFEYLSRLKIKYFFNEFIILLVSYLFVLGLNLLIDKELYTLFTLRSLYLLEAFIFLPYLLMNVIKITERKIKLYLKLIYLK